LSGRTLSSMRIARGAREVFCGVAAAGETPAVPVNTLIRNKFPLQSLTD